MRVVMVMFDSLNRKLLEPYGCDWTHTPNFQRLSQKAVTFDKSWVCSMPCMPARRDLLTGRPNFLHRNWGPIEAYDQTFPELLRANRIQSHLITDHQHYFEDGGGTYHTRYDTWQFYRGQEGDPCIGQVADPVPPPNINKKSYRQDWVNRQFLKTDEDFSQVKTFNNGLDFIRRNHDQQNWFLQMECFDPHEPFTSPDRFHKHFKDDYNGPLFDWPGYQPVTETAEEIAHCRNNYGSLLAMCDESLGRVLDAFDQYSLWQDTMLIVWTDHGFLLGEHACWAKGWAPLYEEVSHTPFFIYDPRQPQTAGQRRQSLIQPSIDLAPTILDFFGQPAGEFMLGKSILPVVKDDTPIRQAGIFGYYGLQMNVTDGRYVYIHYPPNNGPLFYYTLTQTQMRGMMSLDRLRQATLHEPLPFTQGLPVLRIPAHAELSPIDNPPSSLLFDIQEDPDQQHPLDDPALRGRLIGQMTQLMRQAHAPVEQYTRLGVPRPI